ncbi:MAG: isochorismate lyase [Cytophagales bacterium]|nr:isochorismate lyase [Cytophagales bacterium]
MKKPEACTSLPEIRAEIDRLDQQVIQLLGERFAYVKAAARFKTSGESVKASDRVRAMLGQRRAWAQGAGLSPDVIEKMYRDLVDYFIEEERKQWNNLAGG